MKQASADGKQVVVVGAGIVGACCAWHLQRAGFQVTLVDRTEPGTATSFGNAGCLSPSNIVPFSHPGVLKNLPRWLLRENGPLVIRWRHLPTLLPWLRQFWASGRPGRLPAVIDAVAALMAPNIADWDALLDTTRGKAFKAADGAIKLYDSRAEYDSYQWEHREKAARGITWRELSPEELKEREPELRLPDGGMAVHCPDWHHIVDPGGVTAHIANTAFSDGVDWVFDEVKRVIPGSPVRLTTVSGRSLQADHLVLCTGVWSNRLLADFDRPVTMTAKRGYHIMLADPGVRINHPLMVVSDYFILTPMAPGLRIAGTAEFDKLDAAPNYHRADRLLAKSRRFFPQLNAEPATRWMGQRSMTPDSLPVIGPSPQHSNIYYAFGHGHYGLTQGPTTGRIIASLVGGEDPGLDITPYRPGRI